MAQSPVSGDVRASLGMPEMSRDVDRQPDVSVPLVCYRDPRNRWAVEKAIFRQQRNTATGIRCCVLLGSGSASRATCFSRNAFFLGETQLARAWWPGVCPEVIHLRTEINTSASRGCHQVGQLSPQIAYRVLRAQRERPPECEPETAAGEGFSPETMLLLSVIPEICLTGI